MRIRAPDPGLYFPLLIYDSYTAKFSLETLSVMTSGFEYVITNMQTHTSHRKYTHAHTYHISFELVQQLNVIAF